jgi:hypothetical protein
VKLRKFDPQQGEHGDYVEFQLSDDEELNDESLNGLKNALDDLQIVDVVRKPQGLSEDLKAGEDFMNNREALQDLMSKGFTPAATSEGSADEIISSDGELIATMKNGAEYVLRFGNLTNVDGGGKDAEQAAKQADAAAEKSNDSDVNRYLFVMARFNESAVKQPELQQLPELPAKPEGESAGAAASTEEAATDGAAEGAESAQSSAEGEGTDSEKAGTDDAAAEDGKAAADGAAVNAGGKTDEAAAADGAEKDKELEKIIAERKRIEQENQRKLDEYQESLKKGRESVKELNVRFGDWYFVVDDKVFQKVRLSREDVIKKKEKPQADGEAATSDKASEPAAPGVPVPGLPQIPGANE